jgi:phosphate/sulfate permease
MPRHPWSTTARVIGATIGATIAKGEAAIMTAVGPIITTTVIVDADIAVHPMHDS